MLLRRAAAGCHVLVMAALAAALLPPLTAPRLAVALLLVLPLSLALPGVARGRRAVLQRTAVLLVVYIGGATVEVVAQAGRAPLLSAALLAAVLELGLVLAVIRRSAPSSQAAPE